MFLSEGLSLRSGAFLVFGFENFFFFFMFQWAFPLGQLMWYMRWVEILNGARVNVKYLCLSVGGDGVFFYQPVELMFPVSFPS